MKTVKIPNSPPWIIESSDINILLQKISDFDHFA